MDLNLAEQVLLLGLRDDKGDTGLRDLGAGLAGALLVDLGEVGALRLEGDKLHPEPVRVEHPVLAKALEVITVDKLRTPRSWVSRLPRALKPIVNTVADPLVEQEFLRRDRRTMLRWIDRTRHYPTDPAPKAALRARLHDVLVESAEPTAREALLVGLLVPMDLVKEVVPRVERKGATKRARQIAENGIAGTAVADAVREVRAAVMTAVAVSAVTAGASSS